VLYKIRQLAAAQGNALAQYNLGLKYDKGDGIPEDDAEASRWFLKSAIQGDIDAQFALAMMFVAGEGVSKDYVKAYSWLSLSAAQGSGISASRKSILADTMTAAQITAAQALSTRCYSSGYKQCE
jgi:TPR repeat protein